MVFIAEKRPKIKPAEEQSTRAFRTKNTNNPKNTVGGSKLVGRGCCLPVPGPTEHNKKFCIGLSLFLVKRQPSVPVGLEDLLD